MSDRVPHPIPPEPNSTGAGNDRLYTISQAADSLQLPVTWLYERTRKAAIPHRKMGKYVRFTEADLSAIKEMCSRGPRVQVAQIVDQED
jgi:excisionase family DNA binding protein